MKTADKGSGKTESKESGNESVYSHLMHLKRLGVEVGNVVKGGDAHYDHNVFLRKGK